MSCWKRTLLRIRNYEFWPFAVFYFPSVIFYLFLALKHRSFFFFSASNPKIETGGMLGESKSAVFKLIPERFYPRTQKFEAKSTINQLIGYMQHAGLDFPVILKPDIGERGWMVEKINNESHLGKYLENIRVDFLVQQYVDYPLELGIFYIRYPDEPKGMVTSIVRKGLLSVVGDGENPVSTLLMKNMRAQLQYDFTSDFNYEVLTHIPPAGETYIVQEIGNHCRGTIFYNDNHEIDQDLAESIDRIAREIPEFYFGRFDIRTTSYDDLRKGRNFAILELNGAGSEPGHIYDPDYTVLQAQRDVLWHLWALSKVSMANHQKGIEYTSLKSGIKKMGEIRRYNQAK